MEGLYNPPKPLRIYMPKYTGKGTTTYRKHVVNVNESGKGI
jgi:hypothetical protein